MKYALLFRTLYIDGVYYYQSLEKVEAEDMSDSRIKVLSNGKFQGKSIALFDKKEKYGYIELTEDEFINIPTDRIVFLKLSDGTLETIANPNEESNVMLEFQKKFHDFPIVPDFNIEDNILNIKEDLKYKLLGQDEAIHQTLTKIYNNQMFFETELDREDIRNHKSNILLLGPSGTGKSTIKESIKRNMSPVPTIEYTLTGDIGKDVAEVINKLLFASNNNLYLAERGIVIFDGINNAGVMMGDNKLDSLRELLESKYIYYRVQDGSLARFDLSLITFMCIVDVDYDYNDEAVYDNFYYSKIDGNKLLEMGFTINILTDLFGKEVVYMNEITTELAFNILKNKYMSPLYRQRQVLEQHGKKVRISKDFADYLVHYGLDLNEGITGIIKTLNVLLESKDLTARQITFKEDDLKGLMIGAAIPEGDEKVKFASKKELKAFKNDALKVDLQKRTINELTVNDAVEVMKKTIIGQDKQLFYFVNAFYNHIFNQYEGFNAEELLELKENVLLFGPAGVGKTSILRKLSDMFDIPFVRADVTAYSKAGYVGEDVNSILLDLIDAAHGDIKKAEHGILFLDGSNPGKFSRKNYENLCYLLDTISAEVKIKNKKIRLKIEEE